MHTLTFLPCFWKPTATHSQSCVRVHCWNLLSDNAHCVRIDEGSLRQLSKHGRKTECFSRPPNSSGMESVMKLFKFLKRKAAPELWKIEPCSTPRPRCTFLRRNRWKTLTPWRRFRTLPATRSPKSLRADQICLLPSRMEYPTFRRATNSPTPSPT